MDVADPGAARSNWSSTPTINSSTPPLSHEAIFKDYPPPPFMMPDFSAHADGPSMHPGPIPMLSYDRPPPSHGYALPSPSTPPPPPPMPEYTTNGGPDRHGRTQAPPPHMLQDQQHSRTSSSPGPQQDPSAFGLDGGPGANHYASAGAMPRLPPILQVEKQQVTTSATQIASASRRRNEAHFVCPVPGCGSTFTRRFNLRGHLRSHTEERPFVCNFPDCNKSFARQHDCKRHQALHQSDKAHANTCQGCKKTFSRLDALNRHRKSGGCPGAGPSVDPSQVRSEGGSDCRDIIAREKQMQASAAPTV
ncbi:hypothetical protein GGF50DRAFT_95008 [Schizophyllum commune]